MTTLPMKIEGACGCGELKWDDESFSPPRWADRYRSVPYGYCPDCGYLLADDCAGLLDGYAYLTVLAEEAADAKQEWTFWQEAAGLFSEALVLACNGNKVAAEDYIAEAKEQTAAEGSNDDVAV